MLDNWMHKLTCWLTRNGFGGGAAGSAVNMPARGLDAAAVPKPADTAAKLEAEGTPPWGGAPGGAGPAPGGGMPCTGAAAAPCAAGGPRPKVLRGGGVRDLLKRRGERLKRRGDPR